MGDLERGWQMPDQPGRLVQISTVRFVIDSSFDVTHDPTEYWKSAGGTVKWETSNVGGKCRISQAGSSRSPPSASSSTRASMSPMTRPSTGSRPAERSNGRPRTWVANAGSARPARPDLHRPLRHRLELRCHP